MAPDSALCEPARQGSRAAFAAVYRQLTHMIARERDWDAAAGGDAYRLSPNARSARTARIRYERILLLRAPHEELRALPASDREVMVLFRVQALKCAGIAGQMGRGSDSLTPSEW